MKHRLHSFKNDGGDECVYECVAHDGQQRSFDDEENHGYPQGMIDTLCVVDYKILIITTKRTEANYRLHTRTCVRTYTDTCTCVCMHVRARVCMLFRCNCWESFSVPPASTHSLQALPLPYVLHNFILPTVPPLPEERYLLPPALLRLMLLQEKPLLQRLHVTQTLVSKT